MEIFFNILLVLLFCMDFFIVNKQKKRIEELTKENDKLKKVIVNKKEMGV